MMTDWTGYSKQVSAAVRDLGHNAPEVVAGFAALNKASHATTHLDAKTRELIALAVAVTTRCDGCISAHVAAAIKAGATKPEIAEALGVAIALNAGAALVYSARVMDAFDQHSATA